jgi:putative ABC transport system substrate-binding protein
MASYIERRKFLATLGGAAAWPRAARAQQPAMPVIGFLGFGALDTSVLYLAAFRKDLNEIGFVEGQNVAIEYRWAEGRYDRMPELAVAADLIRRRVVIIAIPGSPPTVVRAVQAAASAIPIVFGVGDDPVKVGLVASLSRPGGHATGINFFTAELVAKRLALLHELVPGASRIGVLVNPADPARVESVLGDAQTAAISSRQPVLLPASGQR